ncbi:hypothetical protein V8J36_16840 [Frigidibacter sp. MR17.14]|uniref:hypothetical protein n=1 Tax=Frigidibacter sp. MR17.14 TaxID=3126509 RepID=UPI0030131E2D
MGMLKSIAKRFSLSRNFAPREALLVIFGTRDKRRSVTLGESWGRLTADQTARSLLFRLRYRRLARRLRDRCGPDMRRCYRLVAIARDLVEADWYAERHKLPRPAESLEHFLTEGLSQRLAPARPYASSGRLTLQPWAMAFLQSLDFPIGALCRVATEPPLTVPPLSDLCIRNTMGRRVAVVTAIFGRDASAVPPLAGFADTADHYLITDHVGPVAGPWRRVEANFFHHDPRRRAAYYKCHLPTFFGDYDWIVWTDGILGLREPDGVDLALSGSVDFVVAQDAAGNSLRDEFLACVIERREPSFTLARHLATIGGSPDFQTAESYDTGFLALRPGAAEVQALSSAWWQLVANGVANDALSLPLALARTPRLRWRALASPAAPDSPLRFQGRAGGKYCR